jgi:5-formyltetrahydrofolate cyclo-ligase
MIFRFFKKAQKIREQTKTEKKASIRKSITAKWFDLTEKNRIEASIHVEVNLARYLATIGAKQVLFYASMKDEPSTDDILDQWITDPGKTLALTRTCIRNKQLDPLIVTSWNDLEMGRFHIRMPKPDCEIIDLINLDAVVVPGRAFDTDRNRLGRGYGFYDRFLSVVPRKVPLIGLAFDFQIVKLLPAEEHDIPMDIIITQKKII